MAMDNFCRFKGEVVSVVNGLTKKQFYYVLFIIQFKNGKGNNGKPHYQFLTCKRFSKEPIHVEELKKGSYVEVEGCLRTEFKTEGNEPPIESKYLQWVDLEVLSHPHDNVADNTPQKTIVVDITGQNGKQNNQQIPQNVQQTRQPPKPPERKAQEGDDLPFDDYTFPDEAPF